MTRELRPKAPQEFVFQPVVRYTLFVPPVPPSPALVKVPFIPQHPHDLILYLPDELRSNINLYWR
jgi:hypothetical protein